MIQFDTTQTRSLAKPTETPKSSIMLGGGGGWGRGPADFQARLFVSLDTTVAVFCSIPYFQMIYKVLPIGVKGNY